MGFDFYFPGIFLAIIWIDTISRLRFVYAALASWLVTISYLVVIIVFNNALEGGVTGRNLPLFINNSFFITGINILGMFASYYLEYNMRKNFVQMCQTTSHNRKRLEQLAELVTSSKKNLEKGQELITSSDNTIKKIDTIDQYLREIMGFFDTLHTAMKELLEINTKIRDDTQRTKEKINTENSIVEQSGTSINEITLL